MTSDTTGPVEAAGGTDDKPHFTHDLLATELTHPENQSLGRSRKVAFFALATCSVLAIAAAVYFWYLWFLTAKTCVDTYIFRTIESAILHPELADTWQKKFISLDISSFSALTLAVFLTRLAYGGVRNTIRLFQRDGWAYFGYAYRSILFSEGFETLCVRFGLLGTLLSFLLAAVSQMSITSVTPESTPGTTVADLTRAIAEDPISARDMAREITAKNAAGEESQDIFLLLCASLVSTFVGTGVAYVIIPSLNWLNERAVGLHQLGQTDAASAADEFFRQISRTSRRLAEFDATTSRLTDAAEHISSFEVSVAAAATNLVNLTTGLERAIQTFDVSTQTGKQLNKKLDQLESMSNKLSALLDRLPDRLNDPLKNMSLTAKGFRDAAISGENAFRQLKEVASAAHGPLSESTQRTNTTWQMLRELQDSLRELSVSEQRQTIEVEKLVQAFDRVGNSLGGVIGQLDSVGTHLRQTDDHDRAAARLPAVQRTQSSETTAGLSGNDGHDLTRHGYQASARGMNRPRPWWRRIFR